MGGWFRFRLNAVTAYQLASPPTMAPSAKARSSSVLATQPACRIHNGCHAGPNEIEGAQANRGVHILRRHHLVDRKRTFVEPSVQVSIMAATVDD